MAFPDVEWIQQDISVDPSGSRHLKSGAAGFVKELNTSAGGQLDFGSINISPTGAISDTKLCYARVDSFGEASGVFNMRFFLSNISAWDGTYRFLEHKNLEFRVNLNLDESFVDTPVSVPAVGNLIATRRITAPLGDGAMSGVFDEDVSQYVYLAVLARNDVSLGQKGGAGAGTFRYRLLYDFS
jgi:hypothetical protein